MRLTLRTLLAYRDRVLSPADTEDLHRRIQSSHDAGNLLRRIGAVTQRNAVLAPTVLGKGLGADPNSVAEYLDDALPHAQVPEMERICLVSDVQLAELADCHSLLSSALNTKVVVSSELRRMALAVGDVQTRANIEQELELRKAPRRRNKIEGAIVRNDRAHSPPLMEGAKPSVAVHVQSPMLVSGGESIRPRGLDLESAALTHEVPEYLMNSASGNWKIPLAIGALASLLAVLLWRSLGPWEKVSDLFASSSAQIGSPDSNSRPIDFDLIVESEQGPPGITSVNENEREGGSIKEQEENVTDDAGAIDTEDSGPPGASPLSREARKESAPSAAVSSGNVSAEIDEETGVEEEQTSPPGLSSLASRTLATGEPSGTRATLDPAELPPKPSEDRSFNNKKGAGGEADEEGLPLAPPATETVGTANANSTVDLTAELKAFSDRDAPPDVSNSTVSGESHASWLPSNAQEEQAVLLWQDQGVWRRVKPGQTLPVGSRLVVPPSTRTTLDLPGGVLWTACGPSQLELVANGGGGVRGGGAAQIVTPLCRALIRGGPDGRVIRLSTPVGNFEVDLNQPNSLASIEVAYRSIAPGSILDRQSTTPILVIVAAEESLRVTSLGTDGKSFDLKLGDGLACIESGKPTKFRLQNIPGWFRSSVERPIDSLAISDLHQTTEFKAEAKITATQAGAQNVPSPEDADISSQLEELRKSRRPETAALAVQVSMLCGNWQPLASGFLDEARMRSHWTPTLNLARQLMAADPSANVEIRQAFADGYADDGKEIVDLLCGIPSAQLDAETLAKVVQRLESPRLAMRVVAIYQLQLLTGKSLGIQPTNVSRGAVQQWRRELASNRDILLPIPNPIWESVPNGE